MTYTYEIEIDCANCARKVEEALNKLPGIKDAKVIFIDKKMKIDADVPDEEYPALEKLIESTAREIEDEWEMRLIKDAMAKRARKQTYGVEIDCANCARKVEEALNRLENIVKAQLIFVDKRLTVETKELDDIELAELESLIDATARRIESGWEMWPYTEEKEEEEKRDLMPLRIAAGFVFMIFGLLLEYVLDIEIDKTVLLGIFFCGLLIVGYDVIISAFRNLSKARFLDENFLMMIATFGALAVSMIGDDAYWSESVAVMVFYQVGEYFQGRAISKTRSSVKALVNLKAPYATVVRDDEIVRLKTEAVKVGDTIIVKPGELIPVDGIIVSGETFVDTKAMTGESVPRKARKGDEVLSGYLNTDSAIKMTALRHYRDSASSKVLALIEDSASRKASSEKFITRFARYYTPAVVGLALAIAVIPSLIWPADFTDWLIIALTFLVVSCPCALVVSIPLSYFCGIGNASRQGILIKGSNYIETMSKTGTAVFDKTGTLTKGEFSVKRIECAEGMTEEDLIRYAAEAESFSTHPIARSICAYGKVAPRPESSQSTNHSGKGVTAEVDGRSVSVGNAELMSDLGINVPDTEESGTHVYVSVDGFYAGHIVIADSVKDDAKTAVSDLKKAGIRTIMLTGDTDTVGRSVAEELGLDDYKAGLLPADKTAELEKILEDSEGSTIFVGDGINDAPSLARADVGVAMGNLGSDAAVEAADMVIIDDSPSKIIKAIDISKKTQRIVKQNIWFSLIVKFAIMGIVLTVGSVASANMSALMWLAIFGDVGVLIAAIMNSMRALGRMGRTDIMPEGYRSADAHN